MPLPEPFLVFTHRLNQTGLRYMVSGSVAAIFYGEPRLTNDVDLVLFLKRSEAKIIAQAFPDEEFYCPPPEVIELEAQRNERGHFNLIHHATGFKADVYLAGRDALHAWALPRAAEAHLGEETLWIAPPEYVILRKLQFFREGGGTKHLRDIQRMFVGLGDDWNREALMEKIDEHGLVNQWALAMDWTD